MVSSYWDTQTSGQSSAFGSATHIAGGLTTAQMQGVLQAGFNNTVWGTGASLFPYLLWQFSSGTPQTVSGTAFSDGGVQFVDFLLHGRKSLRRKYISLGAEQALDVLAHRHSLADGAGKEPA